MFSRYNHIELGALDTFLVHQGAKCVQIAVQLTIYPASSFLTAVFLMKGQHVLWR